MDDTNKDKNIISFHMELPEKFGDNETFQELRQVISELRDMVNNINSPISFNEQALANYFGISKLSLERLRRSGKIKYKRIAGKIHYTREHVEEFLNSDNSKKK